jgi:hypothetical protein
VVVAEVAGAAQERRHRRNVAVTGGLAGQLLGVDAGGEDAFDGAIGRVTGLDRAGAGGLDAVQAVFVPQSEDALGCAKVVDRVGRNRSPMTSSQAGLISAVILGHQFGPCRWKAIFSGG